MNMQKVQTHSVFRILDHNGRSDSDRSRNRKNENIDPTRSHLNYNLAAKDQPLPPYEYFLKRKNEVYAHGNASVGIVSWVITKPKTLPENETEDFFKAAYEFFEKKHGKENVVSAYVHMDETTPHLHFCFVPVVVDEKKGEKLCAKSVTTKRYLDKAHPEAEEYISNALGHHVDIINEATKEGNKSIEEFKRGKAKEDLEKAKAEAEKIVSEAEDFAKEYEAVSAAYEAKKEVVDRLEAAIEDNEEIYGVEEHKPTHDEPEHYFKVPADIWYHQRVSREVVEIYSDVQDKSMDYADKLVEYEKANRSLIKENITLSEKINKANEEIKNLSNWIIKFKKALKKLSERIPDFHKVFTGIAKEVEAEEEKIKRNKEFERADRNDINNNIER